MAIQSEDRLLSEATRGMAAGVMRQNNGRAVLAAVALESGCSGADITRTTGLGAQTVSRILMEFETSGLVRRGEPRRGQRGQPATPIYINPEGAFCIGCEIGWRHVEILMRDLDGQVLGHHRRDYAFVDADTIVEEVASLTRLMAGLVPEPLRPRIVGIGLALPSRFARTAEMVGASPELAAQWASVDPAAALRAATGMDVFCYNDGDAGCWAELAALPVPRPRNLAYILLGTLIATGLFADGRLWEGGNGRSADLGSMMVTDRNGEQAYVHQVASLVALERRLAEQNQPMPASDPMGWDWDSIEGVQDWLSDAARAIAKSIVNACAVIALDVVIIDGVMPKPVVGALVEKITAYLATMPALTGTHPVIQIGSTGNAAPALGAARLPLYRRLFSRDPADIAGSRVSHPRM